MLQFCLYAHFVALVFVICSSSSTVKNGLAEC